MLTCEETMHANIHDPQDLRRVAARVRACLEMFEDGVDMIRCRLRRENPGVGADELSKLLRHELMSAKQDTDPYLQPPKCPRFSHQR